MEVVNDVRTLLGAREALLNDVIYGIFRAHNTESLTHLEYDDPSGGGSGEPRTVVISTDGEVSASEYKNLRHGDVVTVDHITQEVTSVRPASPEDAVPSLEPLRKALDVGTEIYVRDQFLDGHSAVYSSNDGSNDVISIIISGTQWSAKNFWSGSWRSKWNCVVTADVLSLTGTLLLDSHYYEDGNVQLKLEHTVGPIQVANGDCETAAVNVISGISGAEDVFQRALGNMFDRISETSFKALRRALPVTRTKMDWSKVRNYTLMGGDGIDARRGGL